jgi:predicted RND superfamily exporter protein
VLQRLIDQRGDESLAGASICIWDRAVQPALAEQPDQQDERSADSAANQQRILVESAERLLSSARFKLTHTSLDFAQMPAAAKQQLLAQLRDFDSVVLIGGFTDADVQELQQAGVSLADARHLLAERMRESLDARVSADSVSAVYTGVVPIVYKAQRALLDNLIQSTTWSFIMITPLLMLVSRSVMGGAVAMLPNVLPVLMVFGGMGWLGFAIDIGSMMSASVALGVAVDDTIHFLTWYREDLKRLANRRAAIQSAYRRCGPPTLQAALISGLGLSVFVFSTFTPTQRLGWLMMTILLTGVVAELVMLPALLAGPLGLAFRVRPEKPSSSSSSDDHAMDGERATQSLSVRAYSRPV